MINLLLRNILISCDVEIIDTLMHIVILFVQKKGDTWQMIEGKMCEKLWGFDLRIYELLSIAESLKNWNETNVNLKRKIGRFIANHPNIAYPTISFYFFEILRGR